MRSSNQSFKCMIVKILIRYRIPDIKGCLYLLGKVDVLGTPLFGPTVFLSDIHV
jgi:hypothetical protein